MLYVYALVRMERGVVAGPWRGIAREPLHLYATGRIGAVAGVMQSAPETTMSMMRAHDKVVRRVAATWHAVLPVRFGTVTPDARSLGVSIRDRQRALDDALTRVRGRAQMTIRVFGPHTSAEEKPEPAARARGAGARYLERIASTDARRRRLEAFDPVREALGGYVREERVEPHASPPLVASVYHLIERADARRYATAAKRSAAAAGLRIRVSGPFPAYAFGPSDL